MPRREVQTPAPLMLTAGQPFAPYEMFKGPVVPIGLFTFPGLETDDVVVFSYLLNAFGKNSWTQRKYSVIAKETRMSEDRSGRSMVRLENAGLIARERQGPGKLSILRLVWHPLLAGSLSKKGRKLLEESAKTGIQDSAEPGTLDSAPKTPQRRGQESANSGAGTPQNTGEIKGKRTNLKDQFRGPTSSSPPPESKSAKRTRTAPEAPATQKPEAESRWWHRYERKSIQDRLNGVKGWGSILQFPTWADAEALLADNFESAEDFMEWTESARLEDFREAKYWGFLKRSAEGWRSKRDGYREEREREQAKAREFEERQKAATARVVDITPKEAETPKPQEASTPQADPQPSRSAESSKADVERKRARLNQQIASLRDKIATYPGYINAYVWEGQLKHLEAQLNDLDGGHYAAAFLGEQAGGEAPCTESAKPAAVAAATPMHSHRQPAAITRRRSGDHGFTRVGALLTAIAI